MKVAENIQDTLVREYWQNKLLPKATTVNAGAYGDTGNRTGHSMVRGLIDPATSGEIKNLCNNNPLAEFTFLMSVYMLVLHKYFSLSEVMVATGDLNHAAGSIGNDHILFYEMADFEKLTARSFIKEVQSEVQNVLRYRQFDSAGLNNSLKSKGCSFEQFARFAFSYSNANFVSPFLKQAHMKLCMEAHKSSLEVQLFYREDLFSQSFAKQFLLHFMQVVKDIRSEFNTSIQNISLLLPGEQEQILVKCERHTDENASTVIELFEKQAQLFPDHHALVAGGRVWTYKELNEKCNQLAHYLLSEYDVQPEEPVGLMVHNSDWMVIGMLAILKAGAAYVPIEPNLPEQRRIHIVRDTGLKVIITQFDLLFSISDFKGHLFAADLQADTLTTSSKNPGLIIDEHQLTYIIYTSGTTGVPKGVMIENHSLVNYAEWFIQTFGINEKDSAVLTSSFAFDLGYTNIWGALLSGACLHLLDVDLKKSAGDILEYLVRQKLSFIKTTPSLFYMMVHHPDFEKIGADLSLRLILLGGEPINGDDVAAYIRLHPGTIIVNHYGPTEATVGTVAYQIDNDQLDSFRKQTVIGKSIRNSEAFILDTSGHLVPKGIAGELCISGAGLARGYLNQAELTRQKFIDNPFRPGEFLYKTGDIAKRNTDDNNIVLSGRRDNQVKIRGYRVELGEITNVLQKHPDIERAAVVVKSDKQNNNYLVAYYTTKTYTEPGRLRLFIEEHIPAYMIPSHFVLMQSMPLTSNGKIDLKALPEPEENTTRAYEAPVTVTQKKLAAIWQEVLGVRQAGINDNFFELGGHSLKATQVLTEIHRQMSTHIKLTDIFDYPLLDQLAAIISAAGGTEYLEIPAIEEQEHYSISYAQRRLWLIEQFDEAQAAYNVHNSFVFDNLDRLAFDKAVRALLERHEVLRTSLVMIDGQPRQRVFSSVDFNFDIGYIDLRLSEHQAESINSIVQQQRNMPVQLEQDSLFRISLLHLDENRYQVEINIHHIIFDGWSKEILFSEFRKLYDHFIQAGTSLPSHLPIQYRDYSAWQQAQLENGAWEDHKMYWHAQFASQSPVLNLPVDFSRPAMKQYRGAGITFLLDKKNTEGLYDLCGNQGTTLFMGLLALVKLLIHRYTGQEDIVIGSPIAGRDRKELESQLGFYVNTLALRTTVSSQKTFHDLLASVKQTTVNAYAHQAYPFDLLVDELQLNRDMSRTPLFDVMVLLQNISDPLVYDATFNDEAHQPEITPGEVSKFDLTFAFRETNNGILVHLTYNTALYKEATIRRMIKHFEQLLQAVNQAPGAPAYSLDYLDKNECEVLANKFIDTAIGYPDNKTLQEIFEERVKQNPGGIAMMFEGTGLSYGELNERANQLAHYLRNHHGIGRDMLVGLMVERSEWMLVGILGILKSGAGYVPIDPEYPGERKTYLLKDAGIQLLLTDDASTDTGDFTGQKLYLRSDWEELSGDMSSANPLVINKPRDAAYVIYTSGSTGLPKGVLIEHYNVVRLLFNEKFGFDFSNKDVWTLFHSICFDFSVWEIFGCLLYGGKLVVVSRERAQSARLFAEQIVEEKVTVLNQVPGVFSQVMAELLEQEKAGVSLRYIIFGGEALNPGSLGSWHARYPETKLINMYGITETTVHTTIKEIGETEIKSGDSNIGKAIPTVEIYLGDSYGKLVPEGIAGEILVGGLGLARGYLNRPELTSEKFIANPWKEGQRLYRSGDLGRRLESGELVYMGRSDSQVKIRGYRIELGEIEDAMLRYAGVREVVVQVRSDGKGESYLVGYYAGSKGVTVSGLRNWLRDRLPGYMVPSYMIELAGLPLTSNGKVDRKALPAPEEINEGTEGSYSEPVTELEKQLVLIWKKTLNRERIGTRDNFFELGGNSMSAARLVTYIFRELKVKVSLPSIFNQPFIEQLALEIQDIMKKEAIEEGSPKTDLIPFQQYLWMLELVNEDTRARNIYITCTIPGTVDIQKLNGALERLGTRHAILRTTFTASNGKPGQRVHPPADRVPYTAGYIDLRSSAMKEDAIEKSVQDLVSQPLPLEKNIFFKVHLLQLADDSWQLILLAHTIILDQQSLNILLQELLAFYQAGPSKDALALPVLNECTVAEAWNKNNKETNRGYWIDCFKEGFPELKLLGEKKYGRYEFQRGHHSEFLSSSLSKKIYQLSGKEDAGIFSALLAAFNALVYRYTCQQKFVLGTLIAANNVQGSGRLLVGPYEYTLPLVQEVKEDDTFNILLQRTRFAIDEMMTNRYPFENVVDLIERNLGQTCELGVLITFNSGDRQWINEMYSRINRLPVTGTSSYSTVNIPDLALHFSGNGEAIGLTIEYNSRLISKYSIERLAAHFEAICSILVEHDDQLITGIDYFSAGEREQLLHPSNTIINDSNPETVVDLFEKQVQATPHAIAVIYKDNTLSYEALNTQANQLANYLRIEQNVKTEELVGVLLDKSENSIIALLAIMKSGGAYLPIDTALPVSRIKDIINDAGIRTIISEKRYMDILNVLHSECVSFGSFLCLDSDDALLMINKEQQAPDLLRKIKRQDDLAVLKGCTTDQLSAGLLPQSLAYCIYTSGSTGKPKGVLIDHSNLVHTLKAENDLHALDNGMVSCFSTNYSFDVSLLEILLPLINGGSTVIPDSDKLLEEGYLPELIAKNGISDLQGTPTFISSFLLQPLMLRQTTQGASLPSLKRLWIGGESLNSTLVKQLLEQLPHTEINNHYGPTEIAVDCTAFKNVKQFEKNNIGKPLSHANVYILDVNRQLVPVGITGEICIGGKGVGRGYLNDIRLSEQKFVPDPFDPTGRIYRTGDYGYREEDGTIVFIGRKDHQVKIRGHRIETGEIEQVLLRHPKIKDAVIMHRENSHGEKELVAYLEKKTVQAPELWPSAGEYPVYDELLYQAMADDEIRNKLYREAIQRRVPGKTVLEIGPGAELVLTLMCVEAGAKKIYAIEWSEASYKKALQKVERLGLTDKIILIYGNALETVIPSDVDICTSEQIGCIAGSEGAIRLNNYPSLFLAKPCPVIPEKCITNLAAVNLPAGIASRPMNEVPAHYTQQIFDAIGYEFDLRMLVKNIDESCLLSDIAVLEELNFLAQIPEEEERVIELRITEDGAISGFIAWIQLYVDGEQHLDSLKQPVSWLPVYFPVFDQEVPVTKGDRIRAVVQRKLSEDGFHPDYIITGELLRAGAERINFEYASCYMRNRKKHNRFYKELFEAGLAGKSQGISLQEEIRNYLGTQLPSYMVPASLQVLNKFPVNSSGKIDRAALAKYTLPDKDENGTLTAPRNKTEEAITEIWKEALHLEKAGIYDNFFDLGGHSIKAARLSSIIYNRFGTRIRLKTIFDHPTIAELAGIVKETEQLQYLLIEPQEEQEYYAVSHAQKRMWILDQIEKNGIAAYNMPFVWEMEGLDISIIEPVFYKLLERHESLRTTFITVNSEPKQKIRQPEETGFRIRYIDLRQDPEKEIKARTLVNAENTTPFDLEKGPLLRASLLQMTDTRQIFMLTLQHTVGDAWSMEIFENDFKILYNAIKNKEDDGLAPLSIHYRDYTAWQKKYLEESRGQRDKEYWLEQFKKKAPVLQLPADYARPQIKTYNGNITGFLLDKKYTSRLYELSQQLRVSVTMILMASVKALLYKYSGQEDITVGSPIIGRDTVELEKQIGFYTNTLAIRTLFDANKSFRELVFQVRENILNAFDHQLYPFDQLVDDLHFQRDLSRSPIFDVMVIHHNVGSGKKQSEFDNVEVDKYVKEVQQSKFDLTFNFTDAGDALFFSINYNSDLFTKEKIDQLMTHYRELLADAIADHSKPIHKLNYLTAEESRQLLAEFNDTKVDYPKNKLIHELFEEQALLVPGHTAIRCGDRRLTFKELNERANHLAHYLRAHYNVKPDDLFGVMISRTEWLPVVLLGILKAGAGYVPVDPDYPRLRNQMILDDAGITALITENSLIGATEYASLVNEMPVVVIDSSWDMMEQYPKTNPVHINTKEDIFYIIYTSGSTGRPKGVVHTHSTIGSFIGWSCQEYRNSNFDITYLTTSLCFDMSVFEIFYTLGVGKPIRIVNNGTEIGRWLHYDRNILINTVPSVIQTLISQDTELSNISVLNMAGEPIPYAVKERLDSETMEVINIYGPSEYAGGTTFYRLTPDRKKILIGKPIGNTDIYILDDHLELLPVGVKGEIYIAGDNLSRGYLNRPELTREKFMDHPFKKEARIYKSGDIGRWDADGNIEFFGRRDYQVKIRGHRIELGEIETVLNLHDKVKQAVIDVQKSGAGQDSLVGYYTGEETDIASLKSYLAGRLPAHMIPVHIIYMDSFLLNPNGKVDRRKLPPVDIQQALLNAYEAPRTRLEEQLVAIWQSLFGIERIGIRDNFFEIGGHSLLAMRLVSAIRKELNIEVPIRTIFSLFTILELADYIEPAYMNSSVETAGYEEIQV